MPGDLEYNPAEMPVSIGLYGARYTITFYPGECYGLRVSFNRVSVLIVSSVGVDYHAREVDNMRLDVEFEEGEISEEEHARCRWSADDFAPEGGRIADPRTEGPGIRRPRGTGWRIGRAQRVLNRGVNRQMSVLASAGRLRAIGRGDHIDMYYRRET